MLVVVLHLELHLKSGANVLKEWRNAALLEFCLKREYICIYRYIQYIHTYLHTYVCVSILSHTELTNTELTDTITKTCVTEICIEKTTKTGLGHFWALQGSNNVEQTKFCVIRLICSVSNNTNTWHNINLF